MSNKLSLDDAVLRVGSFLTDYHNRKGPRKRLFTRSSLIKSLKKWYKNAPQALTHSTADAQENQLQTLFAIIAKHAIKEPKKRLDWIAVILLQRFFTPDQIEDYLKALDHATQCRYKKEFHKKKQQLSIREQHDPLTSMSYEIKKHIFSFLPIKTLVAVKNSSKGNYLVALQTLFERRGKEACEVQKKLISGFLIKNTLITPVNICVSADDKCKWYRILLEAISDHHGDIEHKWLCTLLLRKFHPEISEPLDQVSNTIIHSLIKKLDDDSCCVREAVYKLLEQLSLGLPEVPSNLFTSLIAKLDDSNRDMCKAACYTLASLTSVLSERQRVALKTTLLTKLDDTDHYVCELETEAQGKLLMVLSEVPHKLLTSLIGKLDDPNQYVRKIACRILGQLTSRLSEAQLSILINLLIKKLDDTDQDVYDAACYALDNLTSVLSEVPHKLLTSLIDKLDDASEYVYKTAFYTLEQLAFRLSEAQLSILVSSLIKKLDDTEQDVSDAACYVLDNLSSLLSEVPNKLITSRIRRVERNLENSVVDVATWKTLIVLVSRLSKVPYQFILIINRYGSDNLQAMIEALGQSAAELSNSQIAIYISPIMRILDGERKSHTLTSAAIKAMEQLSSQLSETQLNALFTSLITKLNDEHSAVSKAAVEALGRLSPRLSDEQLFTIVIFLFKKLNNVDRAVSEADVKVLVKFAPRLSNEHLSAFIISLINKFIYVDNHYSTMIPWGINSGGLQHIDYIKSIKMAIVTTLPDLASRLSIISDGLVNTLFKTLNYEDWRFHDFLDKMFKQVRSCCTETQLQGLTKKFTARLNDNRNYIRADAIESLGQLAPRFSEQERRSLIATLIQKKLRAQNGYIRQAAVKALMQLATGLLDVSAELITLLMISLGDNENYVRQAAVVALGQLAMGLSVVPDNLITSLIKTLNNNFPSMRKAAIKALGQSTMGLSEVPDKLITSLIVRFGDGDDGVRQAAFQLMIRLQSKLTVTQLKILTTPKKNAPIKHRGLFESDMISYIIVTLNALENLNKQQPRKSMSIESRNIVAKPTSLKIFTSPSRSTRGCTKIPDSTPGYCKVMI